MSTHVQLMVHHELVPSHFVVLSNSELVKNLNDWSDMLIVWSMLHSSI